MEAHCLCISTLFSLLSSAITRLRPPGAASTIALMKACGYCGRENDDQSAHCLECGTLLAPINDGSDQTALAPTERRLDARYATFILFLYLGVQIGVGMVVGIAAIAIAGVHVGNSERAQLTRTITGPTAVLGFIGSGAGV